MKLLKAEVQNFGSYSKLEFSFQDKGLALLHGATGSGKSTFQDIPMWILFGVTAKGGNVDDIRSWNSNNVPISSTFGILYIEHNNKTIRITRVRGTSSQNDLCYEIDGVVYRGKDITETQVRINELLCADAYTYTLASYYNEFSPTGTFFTDAASKRKLLAENLVNLDMPMKLLDKLALTKKEVKEDLIELNSNLHGSSGQLGELGRIRTDVMIRSSQYSEYQTNLISKLASKRDNFVTEKKAKIEVLEIKFKEFEQSRSVNIERLNKHYTDLKARFFIENRCISCGYLGSKSEKEVEEINDGQEWSINQELNAINPYTFELDRIKKAENHYDKQIIEESTRQNPFVSQLNSINCDINLLKKGIQIIETHISDLDHKLNSIIYLTKLTDQLRGELLKRSVQILEGKVNRYLETYFDTEMRVGFSIENGDKLDINIWKSGHECSYKQLSKGQRGLLKLCFSVSVMEAVSNKIGVSFDTIMLDESLDGLDTSLKIKAFGLFQELEKTHSSIFVIEHSNDFQTLFDNQYHVTLENDESKIS